MRHTLLQRSTLARSQKVPWHRPMSLLLRRGSFVAIVALLTACASRTPPPSFAARSPADPEAPEAAAPAPEPYLTAGDELEAAPVPAETPTTQESHSDEPSPHGSAPAPPHLHDSEPAAARYQCPKHPEVESNEPGRCPTCGTVLVKKQPEAGRG